MRSLTLAVLASAGVALLVVPAYADHRLRHRPTFFPFVEIFPPAWGNGDEYAYYDDGDEFTDEDYRRIMKRRAAKRAEREWWLEEDDLEPKVAKPTKKKKAAKKKTVKAPAKPKAVVAKKNAKPQEKPASLVASAAAQPVKPVTKVTANTELDPEVKLTGAAKPAPSTKSIGCTAGAAVVTGYGFGDVKPKTCTGSTYAYTASRGGKSYLIELTATNGEVVNVKKL